MKIVSTTVLALFLACGLQTTVARADFKEDVKNTGRKIRDKVKGAGHHVKETVKNVAQNDEVISGWETQCRSSHIPDLSKRVYYVFSANSDLLVVEEHYKRKNCEEPVVQIRYTGGFEVREDLGDGLKQVNLSYRNATVTPLNDHGKNVLEKVRFCGHRSWAVNSPQDVTVDTQQRSLCPMTALPYTEFEIFKVEGNNLYFGQTGWFSSKKNDASKRPNKLDRDKPFVRSSRTF